MCNITHLRQKSLGGGGNGKSGAHWAYTHGLPQKNAESIASRKNEDLSLEKRPFSENAYLFRKLQVISVYSGPHVSSITPAS